ncbi:hypothetical protein BH10ACT7_BH10ACT7_32770 [soil metagenome]
MRSGRRGLRDIPIPTFEPRPAVASAIDWTFFIIGGVGAVWLAYLLITESFSLGWGAIAAIIVFWVLLAYLVLPRLHRILTRIYVPDYFIGRARTSDGLLGDPVNLALLATEPQVHEAMTRAGWIRADDLSFRSGMHIVSSTLSRRSYLEAPVSPLLLFGRQQDFAYQQEVDGSPGKRHHVRFWRCPPGWLLPGGIRADWLAAGTYDKSVGFSLFTLQITHKIDEHTDEERDHIVSTVRAANAAATVRVIEDFSTGYHSRNGGGDTIITDGDLPILDLRALPAPPINPVLETDSRDKRPSPTIVGTVLLALGGLSSLLQAATYALTRTEIAAAEDVPEPAIWIIVGLLAVVAVINFLLALLVFIGSNWARVVAMFVTSLTLIVEAVNLHFGGPRITLTTNLLPFALDILLLLALSSERALIWARRTRATAGDG